MVDKYKDPLSVCFTNLENLRTLFSSLILYKLDCMENLKTLIYDLVFFFEFRSKNTSRLLKMDFLIYEDHDGMCHKKIKTFTVFPTCSNILITMIKCRFFRCICTKNLITKYHKSNLGNCWV